jgi:putative ABC transport system permease protein
VSLSPSLVRASLRHLVRHPWLTVLSVLGIALGVAVVVAIDLANESARRAFSLSAETVAGRATHQLVGGPAGVPEGLFTRLKVGLGVREAAPVVEAWVRPARGPGRPLQLLGVDPFSERPFRPWLAGGPSGGGGAVDVRALLAEPATALLSSRTAAQLGVAAGDALPLLVEGRARSVRVVALFTPRDEASAAALDALLVTDVSTAQELLGRPGRLSRVDVRLEGAEALARVTAALPPGVAVQAPSARAGALEQMTQAFRTNLTALSLLALIVGVFLIYNTVTFSVVRRRGLIGMVRALGVTRREVGVLVLGEAALLASVGTLLGLGLGVVLGRGLVALVSRTLNDLYFVVTVRELALPPLTLVKGLALGLLSSLGAALAPAWEATREPPTLTQRRSASEEQLARRLPWLTGAGVLVALGGVGLLSLPGRVLLPAYAGLFAVLLGVALLTPAVTRLLAALAQPVLGAVAGMPGRMAARGVAASLSRTAVAIAALTIAVATAVGVTVMVASFRQTVSDWLALSLQADVYVQPPSLVLRRGEATVEPALLERLRALPGARAVTTVRVAQVRTGAGEVDLVAVDFRQLAQRPYRFAGAEAGEVWRELEAGGAIGVSEPLAFRAGLSRGDALSVDTDAGPRTFRVAGVYRDYGSDIGAVLLPREEFERHFADRGVGGVALYAKEGVTPAALAEAVRGAAAGLQEVTVRPSRVLREASLEIFDRTFTITRVLQLLAVGVAFIGVLSALMALQLERAREFAVLRALGLTPRQVWGLVSLQTGLMGLFAGLLALPLGLALAYILVHVINRRSFGWTLEMAVGPEALLQAVGLSLLAALLAGLYPSWRMSRAEPAGALREE